MNFTISTDKSKLNPEVIHDFLTNRSYWAQGRSFETVQRSIENSLCFGVYENDEKLVGFARVLTDYAVYACIMDVFILEEYRGNGLGKQLMSSIMQHPVMQRLQKIVLVTNDAHGLYQKYGFKVIEHPEKYMEIYRKPQ